MTSAPLPGPTGPSGPSGAAAARRAAPRPDHRAAVRPRASVRRTAVAVTAVATCLALVAATPYPGPLGVGDRLFPELGNPGYDVLRYDITLTYTGDNTVPLQARTRIHAEVTGERLETVNLDFAGGTVRSVSVNGAPATWQAAGEDLVLTPARPLTGGQPLHVDVRHTSPTSGAKPTGWIRTKGDGLALASQPDAAHRVFPSNDHPSDKAHFTFRVTAPEEFTAVTTGHAVSRTRQAEGVTWTYRTARPLATELAQVTIGRSTVLRRPGPDGVQLRDVVPTRHRATLEPWARKTSGHLEWMTGQVGPYPFDTYGVLVVEAALGFALETQTLSLFSLDFLGNEDYPAWYRESIMVHELAHHWFGNSVSPHRWDDLWLNEGHATWYEWRYAAGHGGPELTERVKRAYESSDQWRQAYGPPARLTPPPSGSEDKLNIFRPIVYDGAAVVLYALRQHIGAEAFERLQRTWVTRYQHGVASTADFIALAGEVAGRDVSGFLRDWLYGEKTPAMPGHPDWTAGTP
ncbi:M1 family metallopeptidase [Streptomyces sp. JJ66]|uniref:M1 family metallopeptidase n=1 Tax=Streptomyces sp. JJ66 TaxID=2803843 RepID=UPI001C586FC3|nr:M1 family metallopeptidase [Streptomyces sp. JJ66]MBW1600845.1 M1 family metallopeptidase [Streptomyces sp. JJ66]